MGRSTIDIFLQPGEYFVGGEDFSIRTLLGSCVSITLWHPRLRIGAMSHYLLPAPLNMRCGAPDARYGEDAMALMAAELQRLGAALQECEGKIFGGASMFPEQRDINFQIGRRNGETARRLLQAHGIPVVSQSLYGEGHRQIVFDIATGHVWSRQVKPTPAGR
ncbi:chemotaxis protein CheD [Noviherbaspirillum humi]|uniref:Probable chemoreceptor glutamine deamidase CheD n=1 Tax=Noviherbaspirillum humi TaxID=1688639 RepID=A0A239JYK5_9BURK|nr:chemotaxis protein CheD [Noviherbaspirillum humi]SNT10901.1 chemotaxis protein CheD [Noviherbaspirillum humi]